ncbi:MAG: LysR family transcriptional regulator [Rhizobiales bacterium]|nr:LysR family transcriptional regulator [Hyphomicrobiales bacterium]
MTLDQFKMLKAVAELGTLKAASLKIFKSQAAISKGIKQLEAHLGVELFDRKEYRLVLTIEGERIYQLALPMLKKAGEIDALGKHFTAGNESHITLAYSSSFDLSVLLPVLDDVQRTFPETNIIIHQENLTGALDALQIGDADIVITPVLQAVLSHEKLEMFRLAKGKSIKVATPKLLARHPNLTTASQLENEYQIIIQDSGTGTKNIIHAAVDGQRRWFVNDLQIKKMLLLDSMGWGGIPKYLIRDELADGRLVIVKLDDLQSNYPLEFQAIKLKETLFGPVTTMVWQAMQKLAILNNSTKS